MKTDNWDAFLQTIVQKKTERELFLKLVTTALISTGEWIQ